MEPIETANDTIAAIATPAGYGAIGVVRMSGPRAHQIARALTGGVRFEPRRATLRGVRGDAGDVLDRALVLFFPGPASYTGEDVVEIHGHGGPVILQLILQRTIALGARAARPGEFSERAFLHGKIDLVQAEAIADLIASASAAAARAASASLSGEFSRRIRSLIGELIALRARLEAAIDFPDELDAPASAALTTGLAALARSIAEVRGCAAAGARLHEGVHVVIAGAPNVGKSTLLNRLCGLDRAIVAPDPGTTRDTLHEDIVIEGMPVRITDTAGLREASDAVEAEGVRRSHDALQQADQILLVMECGSEPGELPTATGERTIVHNKIDLMGIEPTIVRSNRGVEIFLSAKTGAGIELLIRRLLEAAGMTDAGAGAFSARARHVEALEDAGAFLAAAREEWTRADAPELAAEQLRLAQLSLARITGDFTSDDLLGEIFSKFCIGK
jgi:tRNA modification GTPase